MFYQRTIAVSELNASLSLNEKLAAIHHTVQQRFSAVHRLSVALYDADTGLVKTFISSDAGGPSPLLHYQVPISGAPSLREVLEKRCGRVVNDLGVFSQGVHTHTRKISEQHYRSSYTFPVQLHDTVMGFVFFNAIETDYFSADNLELFDIFGHLVSKLVTEEFSLFSSVLSALKTTSDIVHLSDPETGAHLQRMSRFARLIAQVLASSSQYAFDDEFVENIQLFAPLHDVGKICIPDPILLKPARLDADEYAVMKTHAAKGREIIDAVLSNFKFAQHPRATILRNVVELHHETRDGQGYPHGLRTGEIPIEAEITAVADIFDALTSVRTYKPAWSNARACEELRRLAQTKLNPDCVDALLQNMDDVRRIQQSFVDEPPDFVAPL